MAGTGEPSPDVQREPSCGRGCAPRSILTTRTSPSPRPPPSVEVATIGDHKGFAIRNIAGMRLSRNVWAKDLEDAVRFVIHAYTDSDAIHPWGLRLIRATVQA